MECNRDFDGFDLRMRLPVVVSKLYKAINRNGGIAYIHCTAGMGRAPAVAVRYPSLLFYLVYFCSFMSTFLHHFYSLVSTPLFFHLELLLENFVIMCRNRCWEKCVKLFYFYRYSVNLYILSLLSLI